MLGTLVMISSLLTRNYLLQEQVLFIEAGVKICQDYYIEHVLENHLFDPTCQYILVWRKLLLFPARFCVITQNQMHLEVVRRQFAWRMAN
jgi:hypothetical protein